MINIPRRIVLILLLNLFLSGCFASVSYNNGQLGGRVGGTIEAGGGSDQSTSSTSGSSTTDNYENGQIIQTGKASWYGGKFHGRKTASGEIYNKWDMTAAHRTLPLGTRLVVERISTGKAVEVKVNDRGPYRKGRIIDLSRGAADQLDMLDDGVAEVRLYKVGDAPGGGKRTVMGGDDAEPPSESTETPSGRFSIQVGSFKDKSNALDLKTKLAGRVDKVHVSLAYNDYYRVRVGAYNTRAEAEIAEEGLKRLGFETWVVREDG